MATISLKNSTIDPKSGFCSPTRTFHSLRPPISLPPLTTPFSLPDYFLTLLHRHSTTASFLIDATTRRRIPLSHLPHLIRTLASNLRRKFNLLKNDVALILCPNSIHIPILYLALLSLGVIVSPSNPISSISEISRQIHISGPVIAFATSENAAKIPALRLGTILIDSPQFESLLLPCISGEFVQVQIFQDDTAAILYSSGTTGRFKGVELTHRNLIAAIAGVHAIRAVRMSPAVTLCVVPFFHVYGFVLCIRELAFGGSLVVISAERRSLELMMEAVEEFKVTHLAVAPPVVVAMVKNHGGGAVAAEMYDLRSLEAVLCGGAPVANSVIESFKQRFNNISLLQAYGLTETTAGITRSIGQSESRVTGYVGDNEATAAMVDSEGWLRTGDICYFDSEGFLFYVDRMKELIKYKGYQVAPSELEDLLLSHPDIADAAVIPYPDEDAGQIPVAFVVRQEGSTVNDLDIMEFVAKQVAPYKKIRRVFYIDSVPKNAPGKVLRKELIKLASGFTSKL
ncbi:hypothetical protein RD792_004564 [Penstemon davidsonii]|uniref:4-coumarate--CoA ligase n=1 Tax=Penstemon davidsonii TaxID=160366 RepID=A0ABR0DHV5_9LAMI|nr:hypothetical protein RD792_004564 [Penstemon davidsonii]